MQCYTHASQPHDSRLHELQEEDLHISSSNVTSLHTNTSDNTERNQNYSFTCYCIPVTTPYHHYTIIPAIILSITPLHQSLHQPLYTNHYPSPVGVLTYLGSSFLFSVFEVSHDEEDKGGRHVIMDPALHCTLNPHQQVTQTFLQLQYHHHNNQYSRISSSHNS